MMGKVLRSVRASHRMGLGCWVRADGTYTNLIAEAGIFEGGVDYSAELWFEWPVSDIVAAVEHDLRDFVGMTANPILTLQTLLHHRDDVREPPWFELDPGIVGVVWSLWRAGFRTTDSGDGQHKVERGDDLDGLTLSPHVVIRCPPGLGAQPEAERFLAWAVAHGFEGSSPDAEGLEIQLFPSMSPEPELSRYEWLLLVNCPAFYGWHDPDEPITSLIEAVTPAGDA